MSTAVQHQQSSPGAEQQTVPIPHASLVMRAFSTRSKDADRHPMLKAASKLAAEHRMRAEAHQFVHAPNAHDRVVSAAFRSINAADVACEVLIDRINAWSSTIVAESRAATVHTESLGQLVNRLAEGWVRWHLLDGEDGSAEFAQIRPALYQLSELSIAYDDLIADLHNGRRRLPRYQSTTAAA